MSLECGISNRAGAITSIKISDDLSHVGYETLNSRRAIGICGTGAISALAEFVRKQIITSYGSFNRTARSPLLSLKSTPPFFMISKDVTISQYDLRLLQQSKAAIGAAIATLLDRLDLNASDVNTLYLAGQFGAAIDLNDAYDIDMFPSFDNASLKQESYAANLGAETIIVNKIPLATLNDFVSRILASGNAILETRFGYPCFGRFLFTSIRKSGCDRFGKLICVKNGGFCCLRVTFF